MDRLSGTLGIFLADLNNDTAILRMVSGPPLKSLLYTLMCTLHTHLTPRTLTLALYPATCTKWLSRYSQCRLSHLTMHMDFAHFAPAPHSFYTAHTQKYLMVTLTPHSGGTPHFVSSLIPITTTSLQTTPHNYIHSCHTCTLQTSHAIRALHTCIAPSARNTFVHAHTHTHTYTNKLHQNAHPSLSLTLCGLSLPWKQLCVGWDKLGGIQPQWRTSFTTTRHSATLCGTPMPLPTLPLVSTCLGLW